MTNCGRVCALKCNIKCKKSASTNDPIRLCSEAHLPHVLRIIELCPHDIVNDILAAACQQFVVVLVAVVVVAVVLAAAVAAVVSGILLPVIRMPGIVVLVNVVIGSI